MRNLQSLKRAALKLNYELSSRSRQVKLDHFWNLMAPPPSASVLNVGATAPHVGQALLGSEHAELVEQPEQDPRWSSLRVIGTNITRGNMKEYAVRYASRGYSAVIADGCKLPFPDQSFDIVFSNAVIEHVTPDMQRRMAEEIRRVGRSWFVTTPNFWYPIEMHNKLPLVHYLPAPLRLFIQRKLHTWPPEEPLTLLSARKLAALFPGSLMLRVRVTFYPETLIVFGRSKGPLGDDEDRRAVGPAVETRS